MPYNPGGIFSLVATYFANPGTTIRTEQHNPVFEDVASALSQVVIRDGRAAMTGPLNMNGNPIIGVVAGNTTGSVATLAQSVPIGGMIDFAGTTAPSGWLLCNGQSLSRTTYATLFAVIGTTYGAADASSFSLPDMRGRVSAGFDLGNITGRMNGVYGPNAAVLGAGGGLQAQNITQAQLPNVTLSAFTSGSVSVTTTRNDILFGVGTYGAQGGGAQIPIPSGSQGSVVSVGSASFSGVTSSINGGVAQTNLPNIQPTLITNKIIRVSYDV